MEKNVLNTDLTGKVAVVTGAGGVLCSAFAKVLARAGAKVALLDLNEEAAGKFADEITAEGGVAKAYKCNVLDKDNCYAVADAVEVPIILYDVPSRTGVTIAPETYAELAKHPNINGVKEAGGNFSNIQKTRNLCPEDFSIWSGNDDETAAICLLGGRGVVSVVANVLPAEMHRLTELCFRNDFAAAGKLQLELKAFCDAMFCDVNPIPVKTALNLLGWEAGPLRLPLCEPGEAALARIRQALADYGLPLAE